METGSKPISGLKLSYVCISLGLWIRHVTSLIGGPTSVSALATEGSTSWSEWVTTAVDKIRSELPSHPYHVRRNYRFLMVVNEERHETAFFRRKTASSSLLKFRNNHYLCCKAAKIGGTSAKRTSKLVDFALGLHYLCGM